MPKGPGRGNLISLEGKRAERGRDKDRQTTCLDALLSFFDLFDDPVFLADSETFELLYVNGPLVERFGKALGRRCHEVIHGRSSPCSHCPATAVLAGGEPFVWEQRNERDNHWYRCIESTVPWKGGKVVRLEVAVDMTQRKHAQEAFKHRVAIESLLASISRRFITLDPAGADVGVDYALEALGSFASVDRCYVFLFSDDGNTMNNSHEWCETGIEPQMATLQGLPAASIPWWMEHLWRFENIYIPRVSALPAEAAAEKALLEAQDIQSLVVVPLVHSGKLRGFLGFDSVRSEKAWAEEDIRLFEAIGGVLIEAIMRKRLQAEHNRMATALAASQMNFDAIVESSADAIAVVDGDGRILYVNPAGTELFGERASSLTGAVFGLPPESSDPFTIGIRPRGGERRLAELRTTTVDWRGTEAHLLMLRDVTDRLREEANLLRSEKLEAIGVLAGGIAHDFNNILTGILGNISLASSEADPQATLLLDVLDEAREASQKARSLTDQLLTFAKGGAPIMRVGSIGEVVRKAAAFALSGSNVRCEVREADSLWPVEVDERQMAQAIENLIINADQAMPDGGVISLHLENTVVNGTRSPVPVELPQGSFVAITIEDTGSGIAEEHRTKVFDPYFTTKEEGSGLGLATTYSIVARHGGHIHLHSEMGTGTTFTLYLPALPKPATPPTATKGHLQPGKGRILVMDDEASILRVTGRMLEKVGYCVEKVKDGTEAVDAYRAALESGDPFLAVVADLTIPGGMGGQEVVSALLALDPSARVIVSSGYCNDPVLAKFTEYGFRAMLEKPYTMADLLAVVRQVIDETDS